MNMLVFGILFQCNTKVFIANDISNNLNEVESWKYLHEVQFFSNRALFLVLNEKKIQCGLRVLDVSRETLA